VEDLLAERTRNHRFSRSHPAVVLEIRLRLYARRLRKKQGRLGDSWHLEELFVRITGSSGRFGVSWIRTVMSSIFWCSLAAISVQPSGFFADCCTVKASNHSGSSPKSLALSIAPRCCPESVLRCVTFAEIDALPSLEVSVPRGLANGNDGVKDLEFPSPISSNSFRTA
jgi:hypothetical protein